MINDQVLGKNAAGTVLDASTDQFIPLNEQAPL